MEHSCKGPFVFYAWPEDLLRGFVAKEPEWAGWLDCEQMFRVPDDWGAAKRRCADLA